MVALALVMAGAPVVPAVAAPTTTATTPAPPAAASPTTAHPYDISAEMLELRRLSADRRATRDTRPSTISQRTQSSPRAARPAKSAAQTRKTTEKTSRNVSAVIDFALAQIGKPYVWAAAGPNAYDCSGLALAAYARVGIRLPHQTGGIVGLGRRVSRSDMKPGDLVFPSSGHVGIYIGKGKMVHAPKAGDHVRIADVYAFWTARRLL